MRWIVNFFAACRYGRGSFDKGMTARGATTNRLFAQEKLRYVRFYTHRPPAPRAPRPCRARLSRLPRPRRNGQMAPAARLYRQGPPERHAGGRRLPDVVHQLPLWHDPCLWRHIRRTDAARADQVHGYVRGSKPARGDARRDHVAPGRRWYGPDHRAGRPAGGDAGRAVLSRMAGVAAAAGRPGRSRDSRRRVARPLSVGWHTYALVVEANRAPVKTIGSGARAALPGHGAAFFLYFKK